MGNTCYLNSALQCLNNIYELTLYFLSNNYIDDINVANPIGYKGDLAKSYAKFVFSMWNNDEKVITPHYIKKAIAKVHPNVINYTIIF